MFMQKAFEQILEKNYPAGLHKKVMRRVWFFKYRKIFFSGAALSVIYAAASAFMLHSKMTEMGFFDIVKTVFADIDFNFDLIMDAVQTSVALAPTEYVLNGLASFIFVGFSAYILRPFIIKNAQSI
jgi:hypothetical protein